MDPDRRARSVIVLPEYDNGPGLTQAEQLDALRLLNEIVLDTELEESPDDTPEPGTIAELVIGWYDGLDANGVARVRTDGEFTAAFVPEGWEGEERLYQEVVGPYCRLCHAAFDDSLSTLPLSFATWDEFEPHAGTALYNTCSLHVMPHSRRTLANFWGSPARMVLVNELGLADDCSPKDNSQ